MPQGLIPPELFDVEQEYWNAFWDLSGDRQAGGFIPWMAVRHYFQVCGIGDFRTFHRIIKIMDGVYMKATSEQKK